VLVLRVRPRPPARFFRRCLADEAVRPSRTRRIARNACRSRLPSGWAHTVAATVGPRGPDRPPVGPPRSRNL